jgi:hypothetical protein
MTAPWTPRTEPTPERTPEAAPQPEPRSEHTDDAAVLDQLEADLASVELAIERLDQPPTD